ncbi:MAG: hypothetical protein HOJ94_06170, partial [Alphaproteobacteria bacterium]|nr:hypothetical protein [Alphaproteobacteria bacterium]MBT6385378.1 hypothetical protein [Alphaproteobacteria bacterium]
NGDDYAASTASGKLLLELNLKTVSKSCKMIRSPLDENAQTPDLTITQFEDFSDELDKFGEDFGDFAPVIKEKLNVFSAEHGHIFDKATIHKTLKLLEVLKEKSSVPFVPRSAFKEIVEIRFSTKTPPGFKDDGDGDFFIWADFLYGLKAAQSEGTNFTRAVLVTDDKKPDWSRKGRAHPILVSEAQAYLGVPFELWSQDKLIAEVEKSTSSE